MFSYNSGLFIFMFLRCWDKTFLLYAYIYIYACIDLYILLVESIHKIHYKTSVWIVGYKRLGSTKFTILGLS